MIKGNSAVFSSKADDWRTPDELFAILDDEIQRIDGCGYGFCLDAAASAANAKVGPYFGPDHELEECRDALTVPWGNGNTQSYAWLNPPYSGIGPFMEKAVLEMDRGVITYALVPARTDTRWWWDFVLKAGEIRFLKGRLRFLDANGNVQSSAPFPSAVVIFEPKPLTVQWWDWRKHDIFGKAHGEWHHYDAA